MKILSRYWKGYLILSAILLLFLLTAACGGEEKVKPTLKVHDGSWESNWINMAILEFIVENGYGYPVEGVVESTPIMQVALTNGDIHINMEGWEQNVVDWYDEEIGKGTIENLGMTYEGGPQFWVIPMYTHEKYGIKTVEDMKDHWELFKDPEDSSKGAFINCIIGWQCGEINRAKMQTYGLTEYYNIISPGVASAMDAALAGAQKKKEPVFGYYWAPTSIMGAYDWYILEEPIHNKTCWDDVQKGRDDASYTPKLACAYEIVPINKLIWSGLRDIAPDVVTMLKKMNVGLQPINKVAAWGVENEIGDDWEKAAIYYLQNFEDRWTTWMPKDQVKNVKAALALH